MDFIVLRLTKFALLQRWVLQEEHRHNGSVPYRSIPSGSCHGKPSPKLSKPILLSYTSLAVKGTLSQGMSAVGRSSPLDLIKDVGFVHGQMKAGMLAARQSKSWAALRRRKLTTLHFTETAAQILREQECSIKPASPGRALIDPQIRVCG
jgi:hypothetical protein